MSPAQKCAHLIGLGKDEWIGDDLGDIATGDGRRIDDGTRCSDLPTPRCVRAAEAARRSHDGTRQARKPMRRREEGRPRPVAGRLERRILHRPCGRRGREEDCGRARRRCPRHAEVS